MLMADLVLEGSFGLFGTYRIFQKITLNTGIFPPGWEGVGMVAGHMADSVILSLIFVWPDIYSKIPGKGAVKGLLFGLVWNFLVLIVAWIFAKAGSEFMKAYISLGSGHQLSLLFLHLIWGATLGILYNPPKDAQ